jgi:hypothetical protein
VVRTATPMFDRSSQMKMSVNQEGSTFHGSTPLP